MVEQKISVTEESPSSFIVYDCTGKYSGQNPGGYGGPNFKISDIESYTLYVQGPSDTQTYPHSIDVTSSLPNESELGLEVLPSQVGLTGNEMESGLYKFKLETTFNLKNGGTKTVSSYYSCIILRSLECCIEKLNPSIGKDAFKDTRQKKAIELNALLFNVKIQIDQGMLEQANTTIEYMKSQCKCPGC